MIERRQFLQAAAAVSLAANPAHAQSQDAIASGKSPAELDAELTLILDAPVLDLKHLTESVKIESIELLKEGNTYLLRTRSSSGLEVITVPHQAKIGSLYPILLKSVVPAFVGRDAREIESLLWDAYREFVAKGQGRNRAMPNRHRLRRDHRSRLCASGKANQVMRISPYLVEAEIRVRGKQIYTTPPLR